jgi:hypothetical protein
MLEVFGQETNIALTIPVIASQKMVAQHIYQWGIADCSLWFNGGFNVYQFNIKD